MNEQTQGEIPSVVVKRKSGFSLVWIVPIVAAVIGAWLWYDAIRQRGPEITIRFETAEDLEAGKTRLLFRSLEVGHVETIDFEPDLSGVIVKARMRPGSEQHLRSSSRFWVVRPRIGLAGVSGLGTLLSGAYIEMDPGNEGKTTYEFTGLAEPPQTPSDAPGLKLTLEAQMLGSVGVGSPVFHRGVQAGKVEGFRLAETTDALEIDVYIDPAYASHVRANTHFWNASGVDISFGAEGLKFTAASMVTLVSGGVEFDSPTGESESPAASSGARYQLYPDMASSREVFTETRAYVLYFEGSARGLTKGAPVEFHGLRLGTVREVRLFASTLADARVRVVVDIEPQRVGRGFLTTGTAEEALAGLIAHGLRGRLATGSLLTGALYVELVVEPGAPAERHGPPEELELPTLPSTSDMLANTADDLGAIVADARRAVGGLADMVVAPAGQEGGDLRGAVKSAADVLERADSIFASLQTLLAEQSSLQIRVAGALEEIAAGMRSVRQLADTLDRQPESLLKGKSSSSGD